ncbi:hypothetical protein ACLK19_16715 [Escherichia coli]
MLKLDKASYRPGDTIKSAYCLRQRRVKVMRWSSPVKGRCGGKRLMFRLRVDLTIPVDKTWNCHGFVFKYAGQQRPCEQISLRDAKTRSWGVASAAWP